MLAGNLERRLTDVKCEGVCCAEVRLSGSSSQLSVKGRNCQSRPWLLLCYVTACLKVPICRSQPGMLADASSTAARSCL